MLDLFMFIIKNILTKSQLKLECKGNTFFLLYKKYKLFFVPLPNRNSNFIIVDINKLPMSQKKKKTSLSISDLVDMPISELADLIDSIELNEQEKQVSQRLLVEIKSRLKFLNDVGLGYLTLNRQSNTLSGGESQRINLATSLGSSLVGSLYVLDEPSIGLHSRDTERLISVLKELKNTGNSVVVVEHDPEIISQAEYLIDIGKDAGTKGGDVVFAGEPKKATEEDIEKSYTLQYLCGIKAIETPTQRRKWSNFIEIKNANSNNLKNISTKIPLGVMSVITGVSGSGKSSLIRNVLYEELQRYFNISREPSNKIGGDIKLLHGVEFVNQSPIGKSSRSNPATYIKAYDDIRKIYSETPLAKQMSFTPSFFSFNQDGGRCDFCKGDGYITVPMQFMADITIQCESCGGNRFKKDILDIMFRKKNISDILNMTVDEAIEFFSQTKGTTEKRVIKKLKALQDVGIGYIKLGQSSSTLSGGENQRIKLASFIANESQKPMLFLFDEPTTGLHTHDIKALFEAINKLISNGHTVVIIEHNLDIIRQADHIIDLGIDGGDKGGHIVASGTPEEVAQNKNSITGKYIF